ncbi:MAG: alpha/beta fold hydrolase, partial [Pseudomonadota bacterium]
MSDTPIPLADWQAQRRTLAFGDHSIAYWDTGQGSPLLLVHGYPSAAWDWSYVWTRLAQEHRLIAFDLLGFGFSDKPARGYSIHRQADLAEAVLRHLKIDRYDAVVHDYGVSVGQELLARVNRGSAAATLQSMQFLNGGLQPDLHRPR